MKQTVIRTYPKTYSNPTKALSEALNEGWRVTHTNPFDCGYGLKGTEYILEKE